VTIDDVLEGVRVRLNLEAEAEYELIEEIRTHLEQAVEDACARGDDVQGALEQAAADFGIDEASEELHAAHLGQGVADGIAAAALPVVCALALRWLVLAPDGSGAGWLEVLARPAFWVVAAAALLVPLLRFPRWRYALASWAFFWALSVIFYCFPAVRW
jgi:hypothetical protein